MNNNNRQGSTPGGVRININLNELDFCVCPNCGFGEFVPIKHLKRVPGVMNPTGQPGLAEIEIGFLCCHCSAMCTVPAILASTAKNLPIPESIEEVKEL